MDLDLLLLVSSSLSVTILIISLVACVYVIYIVCIRYYKYILRRWLTIRIFFAARFGGFNGYDDYDSGPSSS